MRSINLQMDGNQVCATWDDFVDLHDSPAGFGDTLWGAIEKLIDNTPAKQINGIVTSIENAPSTNTARPKCPRRRIGHCVTVGVHKSSSEIIVRA